MLIIWRLIKIQTMYVKRNIDTRSSNHCCRGKAMCYILWLCVCSLVYPECNAHAPYCHLWLAPFYGIFPHYLTNSTIFPKKKLQNTKCEFWFSVQLLSETFLIIRRTERDVIKKCVVVCYMESTGYCWQILMKLEFSRQLFEKNKNTKFRENLSVTAQLFDAEARTDWRTDVMKLLVALRNFMNAPSKAQCYQLPITLEMLSLDVQLCTVLRFRSYRQAITAIYCILYILRTDG